MMRERSKSQVDQCYEQLRDMIIRCDLAPGVRLTERELIERLGYGRTPVREALLRLDQDRLIDTLPRSGYRVRPLTRKTITDFFAVWRMLAPLIVGLAVPRLDDERRAEIRRLAASRAEVDNHDAAGLSRVAGAFFEILVDSTDNDPLIHVYRRLGAEMARIYQSFFKTTEGREWLSTPNQIAAFANVTSATQAVRLVQARVDLAEAGVLAHFASLKNDAEFLLDVEIA